LVLYNPILLMLQVHIWDFSAQTTQFFLNDKSRLPNDSSGQSVKEVVGDQSFFFRIFFWYKFVKEISILLWSSKEI